MDKLPIKQVARELSVEPVRIREWLKNKVDIQAACVGAGKKRKKLGCGRVPMSTQLDAALFEYLEEERSKGRCV